MVRATTACFACCFLVICLTDVVMAQQPRASVVIGESLARVKHPKPGKPDSPFGVDFDAAGNMYIVELSGGRANVWRGWFRGDREATPAVAVGEEGPASAEAKQVASWVREHHIPSVVVDTEVGALKFGMARPVAEAMGAQYIKLDDLRADNLAHAVRLRLPSP